MFLLFMSIVLPSHYHFLSTATFSTHTFTWTLFFCASCIFFSIFTFHHIILSPSSSTPCSLLDLLLTTSIHTHHPSPIVSLSPLLASQLTLLSSLSTAGSWWLQSNSPLHSLNPLFIHSSLEHFHRFETRLDPFDRPLVTLIEPDADRSRSLNLIRIVALLVK